MHNLNILNIFFSLSYFFNTFTAYITVWLVALATLLVSLSFSFSLAFLAVFCLLRRPWGPGDRRCWVFLRFASGLRRSWLALKLFTIIHLSPPSLSLSLSFVVVGATYAQAPCIVQVIFAWAEKSEITSATYPGEAEKSRGRGGMLQRNMHNKTKHNKFLSNLIVHMPHRCPSPFTPHHTDDPLK